LVKAAFLRGLAHSPTKAVSPIGERILGLELRPFIPFAEDGISEDIKRGH
jgi:hypothetical protein